MSVALYRQPNDYLHLTERPDGGVAARALLDVMNATGDVDIGWSADTIHDILQLTLWLGWKPRDLGHTVDGYPLVGPASASSLAATLRYAIAIGERLHSQASFARENPADAEAFEGAYWRDGDAADWCDDATRALLLLVDEDGRATLAALAAFAQRGAVSIE